MIGGIKYQPQHSESAVGLGHQAQLVSTASLVQQHSCNHISWDTGYGTF